MCACEGTEVTLECPLPDDVITVQSALYGRRVPGTLLCSHSEGLHSNTKCDQTGTSDTEKVKFLCDDKTSCNFKASNDIFTSDPCSGNYKYLRVTYTCRGIDPMSYSAGM